MGISPQFLRSVSLEDEELETRLFSAYSFRMFLLGASELKSTYAQIVKLRQRINSSDLVGNLHCLRLLQRNSVSTSFRWS